MIKAAFLLLAGLGVSNPEEIDWVPLEPACFSLGEDKGYAEERPARQTCVKAFSLSRTEVTNAQFAAFVASTGYKTDAERDRTINDQGTARVIPAGSAVFAPSPNSVIANMDWWAFKKGASWRFPDGPDGYPADPMAPVVHVTRSDAEAYAAWLGARLPSEAEWEYAARGGDQSRLLSWAEAEQQARTLKANHWQGLFPLYDDAKDGYAGIAPVASFPPNGFGLHDMIGNVWEWTATPYSPSHADRDKDMAVPNGFDFAQPGTPVGTIKGGSYLCSTNYCLRFRPAARQAQALMMGTSHIGFRVAQSKDSGATDPASR